MKLSRLSLAEAQFNSPRDVAVDSSGNVYVADTGNSLIRKITEETETDGTKTWKIVTIAGSGEPGHVDNNDTLASQFKKPFGVAVDSSGHIYVADYFNHRIRKITPAGEAETLAGSGKWGHADSDDPLQAKFKGPTGVAVDRGGN